MTNNFWVRGWDHKINVNIQMKATEWHFPVMLVGILYTVHNGYVPRFLGCLWVTAINQTLVSVVFVFQYATYWDIDRRVIFIYQS